MGDAKTMGGATEDLYLNKPTEIEQRQQEHIKNVLASVEISLKTNKVLLSLDNNSLKVFKSILKKMASSDVQIIASGINDMNQQMNNARAAFYGITEVPTARLDGDFRNGVIVNWLDGVTQ